MGGLRTFLFTLFLAPTLGCPADADAVTDGQLKDFAVCAGRLSALMEHQWMFDGPASEQTRAARDQMADILAAMLPTGRGGEVMGWRIDAKAAHARLLDRATFNGDPADAAWARRLAMQQTAGCRSFLLG